MYSDIKSTRTEASLTSQALWMLFARVTGALIGMALPLVMVRIFDPAAIGIYRQTFLVVTTAVNILPLGFQMSAFYYLPREEERAPVFVLNIVLFLSLIGVI